LSSFGGFFANLKQTSFYFFITISLSSFGGFFANLKQSSFYFFITISLSSFGGFFANLKQSNFYFFMSGKVNQNPKDWDQTSFLHQTLIFIWTCPTQV
jgi:hypothetical protein